MSKSGGFNLFIRSVIFFILFTSGFAAHHTFAAARFWIAAGPANWNSTANWSAFSGGAGGASVPGINDLAIFDAAGAGSCTIDAAVNVSGILLSNYAGTITQNNFTITIGASGYAQNSGTFTGGNAAITINNVGTFALAGGTFTSTTANFLFSGTYTSSQTLFTHSAGTFTHNSGTVSFSPAQSGCTQLTFTLDVIPATAFYNVTLNATPSCGINALVATAAGDVINATNNLTHSDGSITGQFAVKNNLVINANADTGTGTITVDGTGAQTYTVAGTPRTCKLVVNKSAGTFSPAGGTTTLLVQNFTLAAGVFTAPSGNLNVGGTQNTATIFTHSGGTFTHNNGTTVFDPGVNGCTTGTFTIDVLNSTRFYTVNLNGTQSCGNLANIATAASDTLDAFNDLVHTDGVFNGLVQFKNNLSISTGADGGVGTIIADGTGAQTYSVAAGAPRTAHLIVNKASGTLSAAGGTTDFSLSKFTLMAGSFTAPTGNFSIGGTQNTATIFTHSGGTFTHNNSTTIFDPGVNGCTTGTFTIDVLNNTRFYNVTLSGTQSCGNLANITTAASDTLDAVNNFVHTDGVFNGLVQFKNNLTINSGADAGTGTIIADGTGAQTYSVAAGSPRTAHLIVNKSAGALTPAGGTTDLGVLKFSLLAGSFTAPTGNFSIGGTQNTSTIFTHSGGTFTHNNSTTIFDPGVNGCTTGTFTIDVLNSTRFYSITLNGTQSCGNLANINTAALDTLDAVNNFVHTDGVFNGLVQFKNNLTINAGADGGTGTIIADGTGAQTYTAAAGSPRTAHLVVNKSAGTLTPAGGTTDLLLQKFTLMAGGFTAPTGNFNIGGTQNTATIFTHSGGTFTHNNSTTIFDPGVNGCTTGTFTIDVLNSTRFYSITLNGTQSCGNLANINTAALDTLDAVNNFVHTDGVFNGFVQFKNNLTINAGADGGTGTIIADGTGAQTYTVAAGSPRSAHLVVNKSAGALTPAGGTTDLLLQKFTLMAGGFTAPTGNFNIGGTQNTATIFTHSGGTFTHNNSTTIFDPGVNGCTTGTFTIDILNSTRFYNITMNGTQSCGNLANINTAALDTLDAVNNFVHTDGVFNGFVQFKNNLIINVGADAGTGTIIADGTGAQTYSVAAGSPRTAHLVVNKSAGALTPAGGTTDLGVLKFSLLAGSFTAPTGNFNVGGTQNTATIFTHSGGTFTHNSGTTIFDPGVNGCTTGTFTIDVINSTQFYNVTLGGTQSCGNLANINTAAADTIDVANTLLFSDGRNNGTIEAGGNVSVLSTFDSGTGRLIFKGSAANQNFDLTGATTIFDGPVVFNKTSGTITLLSACQLDAASQSVTFTRGRLITTTTNILIVGDNVTVSGASVNSYVEGPLRKVGNDAFVFPTGKSGIYSPIAISAPSVVSNAFNAEYFVQNPNVQGYTTTSRASTLADVSTCDYWMLDLISGTPSVQVTPTWNKANACYGFSNPYILAVTRWNGTQWADHGNTLTTNSGSFGTVRSTTMSSFGPITIASTSAPLPVELTEFKATWINNAVVLDWITTSELNNDYFTVERLEEDESGFTELKRIHGLGTDPHGKSYQYTDTEPLRGLSYYRLKQTDFDGAFEYSKIISVFNPNVEDEFYVYPNPAPAGSTITFSKPAPVEVFNALMQPVLKSQTLSKLENPALLPGIYFIRTKDGNTVRLVIQ